MFKLSQIVWPSAKMSMATLASRVLGLVRELAMASVFGATALTDSFTVAYRIPNLLRDLFAEGAFSAAFVPIFAQKKERGLLWSSFVWLGLLTGAVVVAIEVWAWPLVRAFTSESFSEESLSLTVTLVRIMAPFLLLISWAALFMGALNTCGVFFLPALAPALFNMAMIGAIFWGGGMEALGWGVLIGGGLQVLFQLPSLWRRGLAPGGPIALMSKEARQVLRRLCLGTVGVATNQINLVVTTILATGAGAGAVSWLNYAFRLFQFPVGVFGVSVANSHLAHFSKAWRGGRHQEAKDEFGRAYGLSLALMVWAGALVVGLSEDVVAVVYQRGAFGATDTAKTAQLLRFYALGLPFYGLHKLFSPVFFAIDRPQFAVKVSLVSVAFNVLFCLLMAPRYGLIMLPLGAGLSMGLSCAIQLIKLKGHLHLKSWGPWGGPFLSIVSAGAMALWAITFFRGFIPWGPGGQLLALGAGGTVVYVVGLFTFGQKEFVKKILAKCRKL